MRTPASVIARRSIKVDPRAVAHFKVCAEIAQAVYAARTAAGLTQAQLADAVGTSQSAIARIEDADYDGHSIKTLTKIADALGLKLSVQLLAPAKSRASSSPT